MKNDIERCTALGTCAALVIKELVRADFTVIPHVNGVATMNGKVGPNSKTAAFQKALKVPVHVLLSRRPLEVDRTGRCAPGC